MNLNKKLDKIKQKNLSDKKLNEDGNLETFCFMHQIDLMEREQAITILVNFCHPFRS